MRNFPRLALALTCVGALVAACGSNKAAHNNAAINTTTTTTTNMAEPIAPMGNSGATTGTMPGNNMALNAMQAKDLRTNDPDTNLANGM